MTPNEKSVSTLVTKGYSGIDSFKDFTSEMKLELFTMGKNSILMRIENIADLFDSPSGNLTWQQVDIDNLVEEIYSIANNGDMHALESADIKELSLTGN